jgi:hypothetical protein
MSPSIRDELEIDAHGTFSGSVVPQHPEDAGALSGDPPHLREDISNAIGSDVRDFGRSSHLPYQGLRLI